ncbi:hypothetical protein J6590_071919, partial [Homalodisca vitripennis]
DYERINLRRAAAEHVFTLYGKIEWATLMILRLSALGFIVAYFVRTLSDTRMGMIQLWWPGRGHIVKCSSSEWRA